MTPARLDPVDNVVRYVSKTRLSNGKASGSAFRPKESGTDLSVNWLECFENQSKVQQLNTIRSLSRLGMGTCGKLAELNVGKTIEDFAAQVRDHNKQQHINVPICCSLQFVNTPLPEFDHHRADPSHCDIYTLPPPNPIHFDIIGDFISESVTRLHSTQPE